MTALTARELYSWLDDSNFRITTDYAFELINVDDGNFYKVLIAGADYPSVVLESTPDLTGTRLDFASNDFPSGGFDNYRVNDIGYFQLKNMETGLWHSICIGGTSESPAIMVESIGQT